MRHLHFSSQHIFKKILLGVSLLLPRIALSLDVDVMVNPYIGVAQSSDGANAEYANGIRCALSTPYRLMNSRFYLSPRGEAGNSFIRTSQMISGAHEQQTVYDTRYFLGGLQVSYDLALDAFRKEIYLSASLGRGFSKIQRDELGEGYYARRNYENVLGRMASAEFGSNIQVKRNISFNIAFTANQYNAKTNQSKMTGEVSTHESTLQLSGDSSEFDLANQFTLTTQTISLGMIANM